MKHIVVLSAAIGLSLSACSVGVSTARSTTIPGETSTAGNPSESTTLSSTEAPSTAPAQVAPAAPDASPYIATFGNIAAITFPDGTQGETSIVAFNPVIGSDGTITMVVRNNTSEAIGSIDVAGMARDSAGLLVGSGSSQGFNPTIIQPGEIGFGYVYFDMDLAGQTLTYEFSVETQPVDDYFTPVVITELNAIGDQVLGVVRNETDAEISGPIGVDVICFDENGQILRIRGSYVTPDTLAPDASGSFAIDLYSNACPIGIVSASGYSG